jgi:hypothetical protein
MDDGLNEGLVARNGVLHSPGEVLVGHCAIGTRRVLAHGPAALL